MKKIILGLAVLFSINAFSQKEVEIKYSDLAISGRGSFTSYVSKDGSVYKIGDKVKIGMPSSNIFVFITEGDAILLPITNLKASSSNTDTEIKKIYVVGTKNSGYTVSFKTKSALNMPGSGYNISVENAIDSGELRSYGRSSDEALAELKKAKDKLDLGIISQADYDTTKSELVKFIK